MTTRTALVSALATLALAALPSCRTGNPRTPAPTEIEEKVAIADVPAAVMTAFSAKYPDAKADQAEKQTGAQGSVSYELAFQADGKRKEATFTADGTFVEEEVHTAP